MIKLGTSDMSKAYVGSTEVSKVYLGSELVYSAAPTPLPYDAEIEYLENTGEQYIDLGIYGDDTLDYEVKFLWVSGNYGNIFSSRETDTTLRFSLNLGTTSNRRIYFNSGNNTEKRYTLTQSQVNNPIIAKKVNNDCYVNGTLRASLTTSPYRTPSTILVFNGHYESSEGTQIWGAFNGRIYYLNIGPFELIPVRVGQVGYLYDKVSGRLFGNAAGSGAFVLGNDI